MNISSPIKDQVDAVEWAARCDLAAEVPRCRAA